MTIPRNMGDVERILRVVFGLYLLLLGVLFIQGVAGILIAIVGGAGLLTGATGYCPLYAVLRRPSARQTATATPAAEPTADSEPPVSQEE